MIYSKRLPFSGGNVFLGLYKGTRVGGDSDYRMYIEV